jgi:ribonuclease HI
MTSPTPSPIILFCDGASSGNPGPGGWGTILAHPDGTILELGGGEEATTNNRMELAGLIAGLRAIVTQPGPVAVYTDSTYVIRGITQWCWAWMKKGWKTSEGKDVLNTDLWKILIAQVSQRGGKTIQWHYVRGHSGVPGNERVDEIAVAFSQGRRISLYRGSLLKYDVAIHDLPESTELPPMRERTAEKPKPISYLSLVNGSVERHVTWKECEGRVKGRPGAKFKKAMTAQEETEILDSWGVKLKT